MIASVDVIAVPWDDPDAASLREAQREEINGIYGEGSEPGTAPSAADISVFVVAYAGGAETPGRGQAVGCGGLRQLDDRRGELKRMYVRPQARGDGTAAAILGALEDYEIGLGLANAAPGDGRPPGCGDALLREERLSADPALRGLRRVRAVPLL